MPIAIASNSSVIGILRRDWQEGRLPPALLLHGNDEEMAIEIAFELGRVISCEISPSSPGCSCPACQSHRLLAYPNQLLIGDRVPGVVITNGAERANNSPAAIYPFIRLIRSIIARFHPDLLRGIEKQAAGAGALIETLEERVAAIAPFIYQDRADDFAKEPNSSKVIDMISKDAHKLAALLPTVSVQMIRNIGRWIHIARNAPKIVIIEQAERIREQSANALLKMLEEPPDDIYFILITTQKSSILATILSRTREYTISQSSEYTEENRQLDHNGPFSSSIKLFFDALENPSLDNAMIKEVSEILKKREEMTLRPFLSNLAEAIAENFRRATRDRLDPIRLLDTQIQYRHIAAAQQNHEFFNLNQASLLSNLLAAIRNDRAKLYSTRY